MKQTIILMLLALFTIASFAQPAAKKDVAVAAPVNDSIYMDSINRARPLLSLNDLEQFNQFLLTQFSMAEAKRYQTILAGLNQLIGIAEEKERKKEKK